MMNNTSLALLYKNLNELHDSGIPTLSAFETLKLTEKNSLLRKKIDFIIMAVQKGKTLAEAFRKCEFVPSFDIPLIRSGEQSGTLSKVFNSLARKYEVRAQAERTIKSGLVRPGLLLVVALFVPRFPLLFTGKISLQNYLTSSLGVLLAVSFLVVILFQLNQRASFNLGAAQTRHNILVLIPGLRSLIKIIALENFVTTLAYMIESGLPMLESLDLSARSSADDSIIKATKRILHSIRSGGNLPDAFIREPRFPHNLTAAITIGVQSGKLPNMLHRQGAELNRQVATKIDNFSKFIPWVLYIAVAIYSGKIIISFYTEQAKHLEKLL